MPGTRSLVSSGDIDRGRIAEAEDNKVRLSANAADAVMMEQQEVKLI